jgi:hypothetical protein
MNPRDLENRALKQLQEEEGWTAQKALFSIKHLPNGKIISNRADFFGVWDIIAVKPDRGMLMQVCSGTKLEEHKKKIERNFPSTTWIAQVIRYYYKEKNRWAYSDIVRVKGLGWMQAGSDVMKRDYLISLFPASDTLFTEQQITKIKELQINSSYASKDVEKTKDEYDFETIAAIYGFRRFVMGIDDLDNLNDEVRR